MIQTRSELKEFLRYEKKRYRLRIVDYLTSSQKVSAYHYVRLLRKCEYYKNIGRKGTFCFVIFRILKNHLGKRIGIEIGENACDRGLLIYHCGSIVINGASMIGKNLTLHGANCIGNSGASVKCPMIGDNVELGVGSVIIGDIKLGNNVKIGANATVVKSFDKDNITLVGTPAHIVKNQ